MPGFCICNEKMDVDLNNVFNDRCIKDTIANNKYTIKRNTLNKFLNDKLFFENNEFIVITEGVILNKKQLCEKNNCSFFDTVLKLIDDNPTGYFDLFRGSFSGAHYDKKKDEWIFYTDHTEDKPIFYYSQNGIFVVASEMNYIISALKMLGVEYSIDKNAIYNMLTFGFMVTDRTYIKEIKKVPYGSYLVGSNGEIKEHRYYELDTYSCKYNNFSDEELVEEWDRLFKVAIDLEYQKDLEYGYSHVVALSGGLDSRMNTWVAKEQGYNNILNVCFSQSDYLDETIAKRVSQELGTELIVKSLNGGGFLNDYKKIVHMNYGLSLYSGIAHSDSINRYLNFEELGLMHTGLLGGVNSRPIKGLKLEGAYSQKLSNKIIDTDLRSPDEDFEIYRIETREFKGNFATQVAISNYTESITPFQYKEFFDFYLGIPYNRRENDKLYFKWIIDKYPKAAQIPVERLNNGYLTDGKIMQYIRKAKGMGMKRSIEWVLWKLHLKQNLDKSIVNNNMNPYDKWYNENEKLRNTMDSYLKEMKYKIKRSKIVDNDILADIELLYNEGTTVEKSQVLTVLAAIEMFFMEE